MNDQPSHLPLEDVRVIDAATILAGPMCCRILGDYGADVVKIEHPRGGDNLRGHGHAVDGVSLWWKEVARNKRTIALNLSHSRGGELFRALVRTSDVVVENFRPGTFERWGIGPEVLFEENPDLIMLRLTGFGQSGPYASRPGFGTLAEAMSGFANMTGPADGPPTLPSFGLADSICALASSTAVMMALRAREQLGVGGQIIDMNILEPIMMAMGPAPSVYHHTGIIQGRNGNRSVNNAPRNTYQTRDGKWVAVSASAYRIACRVMELVGHPELIDQDWFADGRGRVAHVDEIDAYLEDWIGHRDREEVIRAFEEAQAAIAPIYDARDIVEDPHVRATEMLVEVPDEDLGSVMMPNVMWKMSKTPGRIAFTGRAIGQDTRDILIGELGVNESEFELLREDGAVG